MKKNISLLVIAFCFAIISCKSKCTCDTKPKMVIADNQLSNDRDSAFIELKRKYIDDTIREIQLDIKTFNSILNMATQESKANGLRAYFAEDSNENITLVFVPTEGRDTSDIAGKYRTLNINNKIGTLSSKEFEFKAIQFMIDSFRAEIKENLETDPHVGIGNETKCLFYDTASLNSLQKNIKSGCLSKLKIVPSIKFMAYSLTNPIDSKYKGHLLFHFIFNNEKGVGNPLDFEEIFGHCFAGGGVDTGLPCPDQCGTSY